MFHVDAVVILVFTNVNEWLLHILQRLGKESFGVTSELVIGISACLLQ